MTQTVEAWIQENEKLIWFHVNRFPKRDVALDDDDLYQSACLALVANWHKLDTSQNHQGYASKIIWTAIKRTVLNARWEKFRSDESLVEGRYVVGGLGIGGSEEDDREWLDGHTVDDHEDFYLQDAIKHLSAKHRFVVQARLSGYTLEEIGEVLGLTRERIRQIEKEAKKLANGLHAI